jgi:hypothetical protein
MFLAYNGANAVLGWSVVSPSSPTGMQDPLTQPWPGQLTADVCEVGATLVDDMAQAQNPSSGSGLSVPNDRGVAGCEIQVVQGPIGSTVLGTFLWRFGVLLAVDKGARTLAPWVPIAPQAEITAVEG